MDPNLLRSYANVLLSAVNLQRGQCVLVRGEPVHLPFIGILAEEAYVRGARYVRYDTAESENPRLYKARVERSLEEYLDYAPRALYDPYGSILDEDWAMIVLHAPEDPDFLAALDPDRNARCVRSAARAMQPHRRRIVSGNEIAWLVAFLPTEGMASRILGLPPGPEAVEELWRILVPILRLDRPDPAAAWGEHCRDLAARAERLTALGLESLRFRGPGTDLTVGLPEGAIWLGGPERTAKGRLFFPNIPTEEVFTSPHLRRAEGRAAFTRPVLVPSVGKTVEGGWIEFRDGRAVGWGAGSGKEVLDTLLSMDEGARSLGEVALVDGSSPIFASGKTFHNILFDENAACHIALGSAFPGCLRGAEGRPEEDLPGLGLNVSMVHTDFMIGGPEVDVTGTGRDGREIRVMTGGRFEV